MHQWMSFAPGISVMEDYDKAITMVRSTHARANTLYGPEMAADPPQ